MNILNRAVSVLMAAVTAGMMMFAGSVTAGAKETTSPPKTASARPEYTLEGYYISESEYQVVLGGIPEEEYEYLMECDAYFKGKGTIDIVVTDPRNYYMHIMLFISPADNHNSCLFSYGDSLDDYIDGDGKLEKTDDFYTCTYTFDLNSDAKAVVKEWAKNTKTEKMMVENYYSTMSDDYKTYNYYNGENSTVSNSVKYNFSNEIKKESSSTTETKLTLKTTTLTVKKSGEKIKLSWKKVDGAEKYQIYYREKGESKYKKLATVSGSKTSYSTSKLDKNKTYQFKIRSYAESNGKKVYSKFSKVKTVTAK